MKIINLDCIVDSHATVIIKGVEHTLHEPTMLQWATFHSIDIDRKLADDPIGTYAFLIKELCPSVLNKNSDGVCAMDNMDPSELSTLVKAICSVYYGGIDSLGKKLKPLDQIVQTLDPVEAALKHI